jgi:uncharacterized RDD family membrane protein YckC
MACWLYEGVLLFGVVFISGYLFSALSQTRNALDNRLGLQAFVFLVLALYFTWLWHKGQTLAMKTWHIQIRTPDGQHLTQGRAFARFVLSWVWFIPPLLVSQTLALGAVSGLGITVLWVLIWATGSRFHPDRQFWHDAWAGTRLEVSPKLKP